MDGRDFRRFWCLLAACGLLGGATGSTSDGNAVAAQRPGFVPAVESYLPRGARVMNARLLAASPGPGAGAHCA